MSRRTRLVFSLLFVAFALSAAACADSTAPRDRAGPLERAARKARRARYLARPWIRRSCARAARSLRIGFTAARTRPRRGPSR